MTNLIETAVKYVIYFFIFKAVSLILGWAIIIGTAMWAANDFSLVEPITKFANVMFDLLGALLLGIQEIAIEITKQIMEQIR